MKTAALTITIFTLISFLLFIYLTNSETRTLNFSNYDEMVNSGIIEAGWVPSYLPKSSVEIFEQHNIDSNRVDISFKYDIGEKIEVEELCTNIVRNENGSKYVCPPYVGRNSILTLRTDGTGYYSSEYDGLTH